MKAQVKNRKTLRYLSQHIELWPLERLIPYENNPRTHSAAQVAQIAASIREFGFTNPVLVDSQSGILAGHGRVLAARRLQLEHVPVIVLDHLTEVQRRAYLIADNKLALNANWDEEKLQAELESLKQELFNLKLTGFNEQELEQLVADLEEQGGTADEDRVPQAPEIAVSGPGDVWTLGDHRLICGDATSIHSVQRVMAGERARMTFTDPPYNVAYQAGARGSRRIANDDLGDGFERFLHEACLNILGVTRGAVYICMSSSELHTLYKVFTAAGGHWSTFLIWAKDHFTLGRSDYQRQYEPILYGWKQGGEHFWCGARDQGDVWLVSKPRVNELHPTMKPIELIERAIGNSSEAGDIVLDPFAGSGSTLIACERTGRRARIMELEPRYVDVMVLRWEAFTGKQAVLEGEGTSFAALCDRRVREAA
jgi:DNA modification methylase